MDSIFKIGMILSVVDRVTGPHAEDPGRPYRTSRRLPGRIKIERRYDMPVELPGANWAVYR